MSENILMEAEEVFNHILECEVERVWGQYLTEEQKAHVLFELAPAVCTYLECVEKSWCIANQDRLSVKFRGIIESSLQEAFDPVNSFVVADSIADITASIFNRIKLIVDDEFVENEEIDDTNAEVDAAGSNCTSSNTVRLDSPGADPITFEGGNEMERISNDENTDGGTMNGDARIIEDDSDKENYPPFSFGVGSDGDEDVVDNTPADENLAIVNHTTNDSPISARTGQYEVEGDDIDDIDTTGGSEINHSSITPQAMESDEDANTDEEGNDSQQAPGTATKKGKGPRKESRDKFGIDNENNSLYSVIMGKNSKPEFYKCKMNGCKAQGKQAAWRGLGRHFSTSHAEQWKEATGRVAKEYKCPVDGCSYTSVWPNYIPRHLKKEHPGYETAKAKNGGKSKE